MSGKRVTLGHGSIYLRNGWWWCNYVAGGVRRRESCKTKNREEALAFLHRRQGKLASGEFLTPDRTRIRDLFELLLEDYDVRGVAQAYIASVKIKSIMNPALGDIKASKLTSAQVKRYVEQRLKKVKPSTVNRELGILHRAFQLGYQQDPPLVGRVPYFPKLTESEPRRGFLKPEHYHNLLSELPQELKLLFVVAYHVGLRKGALLRIKWEQVDLASSGIWMEVGKRIGNLNQWLCQSTATCACTSKCNRTPVNTCLLAARFRSGTSGRAGTWHVKRPVFQGYCSIIYAGLPFGILAGF